MSENYLESIRILNEASQSDRLVIFVGAGVSANSGLPPWKSLIDKFAKPLDLYKDEYTTDEFLKIPQMYYNWRGNVEYFKIIKDTFSIKAEPNIIHDLIFDLNPSHIITTNFDSLLEDKAAYSYGLYDVIKADNDVPHAQKTKTIIKMHGDLNLRNIVLKEDDYLSYSLKFPLIETYIKSLLATKIVLFVGYSVNDFDFKKIMQWVKELLKDDFRRTYLIWDKDFENDHVKQLEIDYFRNRGINLILPEIGAKIDDNVDHTDERGIKLVYVLKEIAEFNERYDDIFDELYSSIKNFMFFKYLRIEDIRAILNIENIFEKIFLKNGEYLIHESEKLDEFTQKLREYYCNDSKNIRKHAKENYIKHILNFFLKAGIKGLKRFMSTDIFSTDIFEFDDLNLCLDQEHLFIANSLHLFNYKEIFKKFYKDNAPIFSDEERAYVDFIFHRYSDAMNTLENIIEKSEKDIARKVIALFNYKNIENFTFHLKKDHKKISEKINIEELIYNSPYLKKEKEYLRKLSDFNYFFYEYYNSAQEIKRLNKTINTTTYGINPFSNAEIKLKEFYLFNTQNFLMVDKYNNIENFYYDFVKVFLKSYKAPMKKSTSKSFIGFEGIDGLTTPIKVNDFSYFLIFIMIRFLKNETLQKLFSELELRKIIFSNDDERSEFFMAYHNLIDSINCNDFEENNDDLSEYYKNFILIFSHIEIITGEYNDIVNDFLKIREKSYSYNLYKNFNHLLFHQKKIFSCQPSFELLQDIIIKLTLEYIDTKDKHREADSIMCIIINCTIYLKGKKKKLFFDESTLNQLLLNFGKNNESIIPYILIETSKIVKKEQFNKIQNTLKNRIETEFEYRLYHSAVNSGILAPTNHLEKMFIEKTKEILEKDTRNKISYEKDWTKRMLIAYLIKNAIEKQNFKALIGLVNPIFDYIILSDPKKLEDFDVEELSSYSENLIDQLASDKKINKILEKKLEDLLSNTKNRNEKLLDIYFNHFKN